MSSKGCYLLPNGYLIWHPQRVCNPHLLCSALLNIQWLSSIPCHPLAYFPCYFIHCETTTNFISWVRNKPATHNSPACYVRSYQGTLTAPGKLSCHFSKGSILWKDSFKVFILVIIWAPGTQEIAGKAPRNGYCMSDEQMLQKRQLNKLWSSHSLKASPGTGSQGSCWCIPAPWDKETQLIHLQHCTLLPLHFHAAFWKLSMVWIVLKMKQVSIYVGKGTAALIYGPTGHVCTNPGLKVSWLNCFKGMSINLLDFSEVVKIFSLEDISLYFSPYVPPAEGFTCILCKAQLWDVHLRGCSWRASIQDNKCCLTKQTSEATNFSQYWTCCASCLWHWVHIRVVYPLHGHRWQHACLRPSRSHLWEQAWALLYLCMKCQ